MTKPQDKITIPTKVAVKLSAYLWLRNNDLIPIAEGRPYNDSARYMKPEERSALKIILDEIDDLHKVRDVGHNTEGLIGPNVVLSGYTEIIERSYDPKRSGQLFHEMHRILRDHYVDVDIYRRLGHAFTELGIEDIDPELKIAIEYGTRNAEARYRGRYGPGFHDQMCPRVVIESELKRQRGSKEQF